MKIIKSYWLCASANKWSLKQWKHLNWNDCSVQASGTEGSSRKKKHWQSFISLSIQTYHILQNTMHTRWNENSVVVFYKEKRRRLVSRQPSIISTIYIQSDEPIIFVCLPWGCLPPQRKSGNVLFCILHTCSIRTRALWILISHFVISRYPGGEVCALECEASVCLDVTRASAGDLHFSISGENSGTWLCWIWLTKLSLHCGSDQLCKRMLTFFTEGRCQAGGHRRLNALL